MTMTTTMMTPTTVTAAAAAGATKTLAVTAMEGGTDNSQLKAIRVAGVVVWVMAVAV